MTKVLKYCLRALATVTIMVTIECHIFYARSVRCKAIVSIFFCYFFWRKKRPKQKLENFYEVCLFYVRSIHLTSYEVHFKRMGKMRFLLQTNRLLKWNRLICKIRRSIRMQLFSHRRKNKLVLIVWAWEIKWKWKMECFAMRVGLSIPLDVKSSTLITTTVQKTQNIWYFCWEMSEQIYT